MAMPRDIRRLALVALFQLDARAGEDTETVRDTLDETDRIGEDGPLFEADEVVFREGERNRAFDLATGAFDNRTAADVEFKELAPEWPAHRQPAIDRAILRLAHHEMTAGVTPPKTAINEAVELAKAFSTEKSPAFVNGLLGKVLKRLQKEAEQAPAASGEPSSDASSETAS